MMDIMVLMSEGTYVIITFIGLYLVLTEKILKKLYAIRECRKLWERSLALDLRDQRLAGKIIHKYEEEWVKV
jgi:hypothetical protein